MTADDRSQQRTVPAGGPATINGIVYQMLWSLLQATELHLTQCACDSDGSIASAVLILEPCGGDLVQQHGNRRIVEQLKARPDRSSWSLREVVESVIPDLYLASADLADNVEFRFVTEGRIGRWNEAYRFFQTLRSRPCPADDPLSALDDTIEIPFAGRKGITARNSPQESFWERDSYTERTLFERIAAEVRNRKVVQTGEDERSTHRRLWRLLGNFTFVSDQYAEMLEQRVRSHLDCMIDCKDDLPQVLGALLADLLRRSAAGAAQIEADQFFRKHGLAATPLTDWPRLCADSHREVETYLAMHDYERELDVRFAAGAEFLQRWPTTKAMLALTGESGTGKSWSAYALALAAQANSELIAIVDVAGDWERTLNFAAQRVWVDIAGRERVIPLSRIAARVRQSVGHAFNRWLVLIIDGVQDGREAVELARQPWENWGIRVVFTCQPEIAQQIEENSSGRCAVASVADFSVPELQRYLASRLGEGWTEIPDYIRRPLHRPLLARLYVDLASEHAWRPDSEYELYAMFWRKLTGQSPHDGLGLKGLARRLLAGEPYPWSDWQLAAAELDAAAIKRLQAAGWLRSLEAPTGLRFEITHDRLLNWVVAQALIEDVQRGALSLEQFGQRIRELLTEHAVVGGRFLGLAATDSLWIALHDEQLSEQIPRLLSCLEGPLQRRGIDYCDLAKRLGPVFATPLLRRLKEVIDDSWHASRIIEALSEIGTDVVAAAAREFLGGDQPRLQRAAMRIFARCPVADVLDRLWELHAAAEREPEPFLWEHERKHKVYRDGIAALNACCRLDPEWLNRAIAKVDSELEPTDDLAVLIEKLGGREGRRIWQQNKQMLFSKARHDTEHRLASCISVFNDSQEVPWLVDRVTRNNHVGAESLRALARTAPELAIRLLDQLPGLAIRLRNRLSDFDSTCAIKRCADRLFAASPIEIRAKLLDLMSQVDDPWGIALIYEGRENYLDPPALDLLLDNLEVRLDAALTKSGVTAVERLERELGLLARANTIELSARLQVRRGTRLESLLRDCLLLIGPRRSRSRDSKSAVRESAMEVLYRIGGTGFTEVVNENLASESWYGRLDAIRGAAKRPDATTIQQLTVITECEENVDGHFLEHNEAAEILAEEGVWEPVLHLIERLGPLAFTEDMARNGRRPPNAALEEIRSRVHSDNGPIQLGQVLALGFGSEEADRTTVRQILEKCAPESELARACAIALDLLHDQAEESVPWLKKQLRDPDNQFCATNALITNGTQAALGALFEYFNREFDLAIAANLINFWKPQQEAIQAVGKSLRAELARKLPDEFSNELEQLLDYVRSSDAIQQLLDNPAIQDHLRREAFADEGRYWRSGSKAAAIRCLARIDSAAAFLAAKTALGQPDWHDREYYPYILIEVDPDQATTVLLDRLSDEDSPGVISAIGRALSSLDVDQEIEERLDSDDAAVRRAACVAAGWAGSISRMEPILRRCLTDVDDGVASEAERALHRLSRRRESVRLAEALVEARDHRERWVFLDCLLALADPGDAHQDWPVQGPRLGDVLSPLQIEYATNRLKRLRK